ncbi:MAG: response regulator [Candidatus Bathyarchaeota archaeon]|nr:response regulator [Candidatus Bathyarchaeum tardum]WGM88823.1 MAG: response regulator [Candidatus Bathyarchaeum tardum]WNZ28931.1 MAG: response regulator [Candidatus Bathyarchaeota archaeon]
MINTFKEKKYIKILFVDNDVDFLKSAQQCLELHGNYEITCAFSVAQALEIVTKKEIDIIISDMNMPITDGIEFLKTLRKNNNNIPFIVFTATEDKQKPIEAFSSGANGFIGKTGNPEIIFSTLNRCIEKSLQATTTGVV